MDKHNVSRSLVEIKTGHHMPTRMSVMTFSALARSDGRFNLQADLDRWITLFANQIRITLVMIMLKFRKP